MLTLPTRRCLTKEPELLVVMLHAWAVTNYDYQDVCVAFFGSLIAKESHANFVSLVQACWTSVVDWCCPCRSATCLKHRCVYLQASAASAVDTVSTYLGMRKVSLDRVTPTSPLRIFLNNNATLQIGLLDQVCLAFKHTPRHNSRQGTREDSAFCASLWQH